MNMNLHRKYMNDFANLLVELAEIKKRIEAVEKILPVLNDLYFDAMREKEKSNEPTVINK